MRIALLSAVWRRLEIAPAWWSNVARIRDRFAAHGHQLTAIVAGSEYGHKLICEEFGGLWVQTPNRPLGAKWNAAYAWAEAEYVLILGSDDFLSDSLVDLYAAQIAHSYPYVGLEGIYFHDLIQGTSCRFNGYPKGHHRHGEPIGAGRLIHRDLVTNLEPWDPEAESGLDFSMTNRLGLRDGLLLPVGPGAVAVDIKLRGNLWPFERVATYSQPAGEDELETLPEWPLLQQARFGVPDVVARTAVPNPRLKIFIHPQTLIDNQRQHTDLPPIVVRHSDGLEERVHEVQGEGWTLKTKRGGGSPHAWVEARDAVTLVRREDAA